MCDDLVHPGVVQALGLFIIMMVLGYRQNCQNWIKTFISFFCSVCFVVYVYVSSLLFNKFVYAVVYTCKSLYGTVSSKITLVVLFQNFQDKQKKSNDRIEMYG